MVIKLSKDDLTNDHSPKIPGFFDVRRGVNPTFENFAATLSPVHKPDTNLIVSDFDTCRQSCHLTHPLLTD